MPSVNPRNLGRRSRFNCFTSCFHPLNHSRTAHGGTRGCRATQVPALDNPLQSLSEVSRRGDSASAAAPVKQPCSVTFSDSECCSICLTEFAGEVGLKILPRCGHVFHKECIDEWLPSRSLNCPVCRDKAVDEKLIGKPAGSGVLEPSMALALNLSSSRAVYMRSSLMI